ncbi:MAG: Ig-like domain repeat protein [Microthrixaceae bacterium]
MAGRYVTAAFTAGVATGFECRLDGSGEDPWGSCWGSSGQQGMWSSGALADGEHALEVRAVDYNNAGVRGPVATATFTVAPSTGSSLDVEVVSGPAAGSTIGSSWAALSWSAPGAACYRVELDGADDDLSDQYCRPSGSLSQSLTETGLADGEHTLRVQAQSTGGTDGPIGQERFRVETKAPQTTITARPAAITNDDTATFEFTADETATFECRLDGAGWQECDSPRNLSGLTDGNHTFEVRAIDLADKVDETPANWTWTVDTTPPVVIDLDGPPPTTTDPDAVLTFSADEPASFECRLRNLAGHDTGWEPCASPKTYSSLLDGRYTFEVRATDTAGNLGAALSRQWTLDTAPPETLIDSGPAPLANTTDATISFSSPDPGVTYECALDGAPFASCTSPVQLTGLTDGQHTFEVRAVDGAGLADPSPASLTWTVDTVAPTVTIDSGPSGTVGAGAVTFAFSTSETANTYCSLDGGPFEACSSPRYLGELAGASHSFAVYAVDTAGNTGPTVSRTWSVDEDVPVVTITSAPPTYSDSADATIGYSVNDPAATVECSIDGQVWQDCGPTPGQVSLSGLGDGPHTVSIKATDNVGNQSSPAVATWRVDTTDPVVSIDGGTPAVTNSTTGEVTFSVEDASPTTTECRLDGTDPWTECTTGAQFPGLAEGAHTIEVRATDAAGNAGPAASWSFTVDLTAPVATITSGPTGTVADPDAALGFEVDDPAATAECRLDGGAWAADCQSPVSYQGLANGTHTFEVRATDAVGNVGPAVERTWTVETIEPDTTIAGQPPALSNSSSAAFDFTSNVGGATFECSLDGGGWNDCAADEVFENLSDGSHILRVRASAGGLTDPTPAEFTWTVDTTAPVLELTSAPSGTTTVDNSVFEFTVDDPEAVTSCRLDSTTDTDWVPCETGFVPEVGGGEHTLDIRATDPAGNVSNVETTTWSVDATMPTVQITSGPTGNITVRDVTFTFTAADDDPSVMVECRLDFAGWTECTSPVSFAGLVDGTHTFDVRATDTAGNRSGEGRQFLVDATGPTVEIEGAPTGTTADTSATLSFTVDDPAAQVSCELDSQPWSPCAPGDDVSLENLGEGTHTFAVSAVDVLGNVGTESVSWTVDTTAPVVSITSGPDGPTNDDDVEFTFTADEPVDFECRLDTADTTGAWEPCGAGKSSQVDYPDRAVGSYEFHVRGTDAAGLSAEASRTFTVEITGVPDVAIAVSAVSPFGMPLVNTGLGDDFKFRVTLTNNGTATAAGLTVQVPLSSDINLPGALPEGCTSPDADGPVSCTLGSLVTDATHTFDIPVEATFDCAIWGDSGNNTLNGTASGETICGGGGSDSIQGRGGNDTVYGYGPTPALGATLMVDTGASVTYGPPSGSGALRSSSSPSDAEISIGGADGADLITTGIGDDRIESGDGADWIVAGGGNDTIDAGSGDDRVETGSGGGDVDAGPGNDTVLGGTGVDTVDGGAGNDTLDGGTGADILNGGTGDDTLDGGAGNDTLDGDTGNDQMTGGDGDDRMYGWDGNDTLNGGNGKDRMTGGDGNDQMSGWDGNDTLDGGNGNDILNGGNGNDRMIGGDGTDQMYGMSGADNMNGNTGNDKMYGWDGNDVVRGDDGNDDVDGGSGDDRVYGGNGDDTVRGGSGNDPVVNGQGGRDRVYGDDGNDPLVAGGGGDDYLVDGGPGNDTVFGNNGIDALEGGDGDDTLIGGSGNDTLRGGFGNDVVNGNGGHDVLYGDWGDDTLEGGNGSDNLEGGWGNDRLGGGAGNDNLYGQYGDDDLAGGSGSDHLDGYQGNDLLFGEGGNDRLLGGDGHDYLEGGDGMDYLNGQWGRDMLRGGPGNDELDGGPARLPSWLDLFSDHWNRLYGDEGGQDMCRFGPGLNADMTNYRDPSCELRSPGDPNVGQGWLNGVRPRLDRAA